MASELSVACCQLPGGPIRGSDALVDSDQQLIVEDEPVPIRRSPMTSLSFACMKRLLQRIPDRLRNRYGVVLAVLAAWVMLFADNDLWTLWKNHRELSRMEQQSEWYAAEIARTKEQLAEIANDKDLLEKFARERYFMKRENEDIFVLVQEKH